MRKALSIIIMIVGIGVFIYGHDMASNIEIGENKVENAEENVQDHRRPMFGPIRRGIRTEATENAQEKIGEEKVFIAQSRVNVTWLYGTGVALFVTGACLLIFSFSQKRKN